MKVGAAEENGESEQSEMKSVDLSDPSEDFESSDQILETTESRMARRIEMMGDRKKDLSNFYSGDIINRLLMKQTTFRKRSL